MHRLQQFRSALSCSLLTSTRQQDSYKLSPSPAKIATVRMIGKQGSNNMTLEVLVTAQTMEKIVENYICSRNRPLLKSFRVYFWLLSRPWKWDGGGHVSPAI